MADHFIGVARGSEFHDDSSFTIGTSTGSTDLEVRIADAAGWTKAEVDRALHRIIDYIHGSALYNTLPPA